MAAQKRREFEDFNQKSKAEWAVFMQHGFRRQETIDGWGKKAWMKWIREMGEYSEWLWFQWNAQEWRAWLDYRIESRCVGYDPWPWQRWFEEMIDKYPRGNDAQLGLVVTGKKVRLHTPIGTRIWRERQKHSGKWYATRRINGELYEEEFYFFNGHWVT